MLSIYLYNEKIKYDFLSILICDTLTYTNKYMSQ